MLEVTHVEQFVLFGEQNCPSDVQDVESPLVTLWPLAAQVHRTVSPTEMLTVSGTNTSPPCPTATSKTAPAGEGMPLTAG